MAFDFVVDSKIKNRAYPALAQWQARPYTQAWREFGSHWPWTTPLRIEEYCHQHSVDLNLYTPQEYPKGCFYPICLGFFDFSIDYIGLLPNWCREHTRQDRLRLLFMYHEGDNPVRIRQRLNHLCQQHDLAVDCYVFVSSNSAADSVDNFVTFHDFELWYHQRNIKSEAAAVTTEPRSHEFLCLNRIHKSWRANIMTDMLEHGLLDRSIWSYCYEQDAEADGENPMQVDLVPQLRYRTDKFLAQAPYFADDFPDTQRNDHSVTPWHMLQSTYCNIVLESQLDVDGSGGVFLTEKTFKPIKHGQMFFVAGAAGSLAALRSLGYRVFDHVLDNSYDLIEDTTLRWLALRDAISTAQRQELHTLFLACQDDIRHNQDLFQRAPVLRLNNLMQKLEQI